MEQSEKNISTNEIESNDPRLMQLLQVWRDYYDEIFEVNLRTGSFETLMEGDTSFWPAEGFAGIEIIILAEKYVHPDDKEAFREFFDLEGISRRILEGIYVTKLNFRMKYENGEYFWVKVKNIVPTKQVGDDFMFFACFRRVEDETGADLRYKQELVDALESERQLCLEKTRLLERISAEIRSPLTAVIGMAALAKTDTADSSATKERIKLIEAETVKMNRVLKTLLVENEEEDIPEFEFEDHPINKISYGKHHEEEEKVREEAVDNFKLPENFAFISPIPGEYKPELFTSDTFAGKRILLAEGNKLNRELTCQMLERVGFEVDAVSNGKEAVIRFIAEKAGTYNLIILDTELVELDGYSAYKCIRIAGKDDSAAIPVYAVTPNATNADAVKACKAGFNAIFTRPIDFTELFKKIRTE